MKLSTEKALAARNITAHDLALLLNCSAVHAADLVTEVVPADGREMAIIRLCSTSRHDVIASILGLLKATNEWQNIPGLEAYEVAMSGAVRRAAGGHGSQAGRVIKQRQSSSGYKTVNLSMNGKVVTKSVHNLVCEAFNGPRPTPKHYACHKNDISEDCRAENLYWGTPSDNARDRERNRKQKIGTNLTQSMKSLAVKNPGKARKIMQIQMDARLARMGS